MCKVRTTMDGSEVPGLCRGKEWHTHEPKIPTSPRRVSSTKSPKALARFLGMVQYYKHFLKNLSRDSVDLHQLKTQTFSEMPEWAVKAFARIKQSLLESEALAVPKFTMLQQNPFIVGLDFSTKVIGVTLSQVQ